MCENFRKYVQQTLHDNINYDNSVNSEMLSCILK